jgi:hypothetical protein
MLHANIVKPFKCQRMSLHGSTAVAALHCRQLSFNDTGWCTAAGAIQSSIVRVFSLSVTECHVYAGMPQQVCGAW